MTIPICTYLIKKKPQGKVCTGLWRSTYVTNVKHWMILYPGFSGFSFAHFLRESIVLEVLLEQFSKVTSSIIIELKQIVLNSAAFHVSLVGRVLDFGSFGDGSFKSWLGYFVIYPFLQICLWNLKHFEIQMFRESAAIQLNHSDWKYTLR